MVNQREERPLDELGVLKAPPRSEERRRAARGRILAAAAPLLQRRRRPASYWEVLAGWARPGLAAASIALLLLAAALQFTGNGEETAAPVPLDEVLATSDAGRVPALLVAINEPDADAVVAAALTGNGR